MRNLFLFICFISIRTFSLAQTDTSASPVIIKTIAPFTNGDFTLTGYLSYNENVYGGTVYLNLADMDVDYAFASELKPQILISENISVGLVIGYSTLRTTNWVADYYGLPYPKIERLNLFYYGLSGRYYISIFPRTYAYFGLNAFTGDLYTENDELFYGIPQKETNRYFQGTINTGFSYFISPGIMLELKYANIGVSIIDKSTKDDPKSFFAEFGLSSLSMGASLRF